MLTAIIQARVASTRLPGKVLKEVLGKPLLYYLLERLKRVKGIDQIVVATTTNVADDTIAAFCKDIDVPVYRGSENDVLARYAGAAKEFGADPVMRLTGDCPLLPVEVVERVIAEFKSGTFDYVVTGPSFVEGFDCEIFSSKMLELSNKNATKPSEREHITLYMSAHPEICKKHVIENTQNDGGYRVTVDEPVDFIVVKAILEELYPKNPAFTGEDVKRFLDENPDIRAINKDVVRNEGLIRSLNAES